MEKVVGEAAETAVVVRVTAEVVTGAAGIAEAVTAAVVIEVAATGVVLLRALSAGVAADLTRFDRPIATEVTEVRMQSGPQMGIEARAART